MKRNYGPSIQAAAWRVGQALLEAGDRLAAIKSVRDQQAEVAEAMKLVVEKYGYTGREKEVAAVREIWASAQETAMSADNFIVQTNQEA